MANEFEIENGILKKYHGSAADVVIPDGVTIVGEGAFFGCKSLTSVVIPDGVTTIGYAAFNTCTSLTSVVIPDSVTIIKSCAFYGCKSLPSLIIPDCVTNIEAASFDGASIRHTSNRLGLASESSSRFVKGTNHFQYKGETL